MKNIANNTGSHTPQAELALFASGDLPLWPRLRTSLHLRSCAECRELVEGFREDRIQVRSALDRLPARLDNLNEPGAEWGRLAAEMTANIRLGLEAGECIAPFDAGSMARRGRRPAKPSEGGNWRPVFMGAGIVVAGVLVLGTAWWINVPASDLAILQRAFAQLMGSEKVDPLGQAAIAGTGALVEASPEGIEFRENGGSMGMRRSGSIPVARSVSFEGSASANYVDADTGQITVNTVYVE